LPADRTGMERLLFDILELKNKQGMDSAGFLTFLSLVNLLGLVELIGREGGRPKARKPGELLLPLGRVPVSKG